MKNVPIERSADDVIAAIEDEQLAADSRVLIDIMQRLTGREPRMWHVAAIGFDSYHPRYASGREGDAQAISCYPGKGKITVHLMDGTARHADLLADRGKHTTGRACLYLKRLSDIRLPVLEEILRQSSANVEAQDGQMQRVEGS